MMNNSTYRLRRIAIAPPSKLISILTAGIGKRQIKHPLQNRKQKMEQNEGIIHIVALRSDAIYLLQVKLNPAS
jgi:hypothetical protein